MERTRSEKRNQLDNKFNLLYEKQHRKYHKSEWVKNVSSKQLTEKEERLLGKRLNFAIDHTK